VVPYFTRDFTFLAEANGMTSGPTDPFGSDRIAEIELLRSPLADVLAQVRFPPIASLGRQDSLAGFQNAVRRQYPVLRQEHQLGIVVTTQGISSMPQESAGVLWRFSDLGGIWNVTVAPNFIALESKKYTSRDDFFVRLEEVLSEFEKHVQPGLYDRLGVRYVNRLEGADWLESLHELIRPEVLGLLGGWSTTGATLEGGQSVTQYKLESGVMLVRTARLPAGAGYDPLIPPASADSWLLDMDMSTPPVSTPLPFDAKALSSLGRSFSESVYRYFRWSVLPEFFQKAGIGS
jgi:uncharacterized protein (TIGR04255 family)